MCFRKNANDLILDVGSSEQITLKDWYLRHDEQERGNTADGGGSDGNKIESFNFPNLVNSFDQARTANPTLTTWALTNGLLSFMLAGSDTAALGGDLA